MTDHRAQSIFDRFAGAFPLVSNEHERWVKEGPFLTRVIRESGECKGRVLDLGCGNGFHARRLAEEGLKVCGLEISAATIRTGRLLPGGPKVLWVQGDIRQPYPGVFDTILLIGNTLSLLANKDDVRRVFRHASSALVHNGVFLLHVIDFDYLQRNPVEILRVGRVHNETATFKKTIRRVRGGAIIRISVITHRATGPSTEKGEQHLTMHTSGFLQRCAAESQMQLSLESGGFDALKRARGQTRDRVYIFRRC